MLSPCNNSPWDVIIIGAGPSGIGVAHILQELKVKRFLILEKHEVGASFQRWPQEMRFITPSFNSTPFGQLDLNAVVLNTSPANFLHTEHPSGPQYSSYLRKLAEELALPIKTGIDIQGLEYCAKKKRFTVSSRTESFQTRFVVWAAGEFQYPNLTPFPGAEWCLHNSQVKSWRELPGSDHLIIGAFESGMDAAIHLSTAGKRVKLLNSDPGLRVAVQDPSSSLSPFTRERVTAVARESGRLSIEHNVWVTQVERRENMYRVLADSGKSWESEQPPILAIGFSGSLQLVRSSFSWNEKGHPELSDQDESVKTPGLFLVGPQVRHEPHIFCYIYKFRQRFAIVAEAIASQLRLDTSLLESYIKQNMYLDDLTCCGSDCQC